MSKYQDVTLNCPSCNKEFSTKVWQSANVTLDPYLKDEIKEGTFNLVHCSECGSFGLSSDPLLYHDMEKNLMIYVIPQGSEAELQQGMREMKESTQELTLGGLPQPSVYVIDSMNELKHIVIRLDGARHANGSHPETLSPEKWKDIVGAINSPVRPWPLDHKCVCGEEIRTVCLCNDKGVNIDLRELEPNLPLNLKVDCPECGRGMLAFTCEKCQCAYTWQIGVVDNIAE